MKKFLPSLVAVFFMIAGCKKADNFEVILKSEDILNIPYGEYSLNKMDVYLPELRTDSTKVIILLHGGSWSSGDKEDITVLAKYYRDKGFAAVNVNFRQTRTTENYRLDDLSEDVAKAVRFVASNSRAWKVSSEKIGMLGFSSGAHLALLYTYAHNADNIVKTVLSVAGPTNFTDMNKIGEEERESVAWLLGGTISENVSTYVQASPLAAVSPLSKPTLIFHGSNDEVVPVQHSLDLKAKLNQLAVKNELIEYSADHDFLLNPANVEDFLRKSEDWLIDYLK